MKTIGCKKVLVIHRECTIKIFLSDSALSFHEITSTTNISELSKLPFCASFVDIDNNNLLDLYIANDKSSGNSMYYNNGNLSFNNISESSNTGVDMDAMSVTIGDFNNDQYFDIYSTNLEEGNKFFVNNKDLTFTEKSKEYNLNVTGLSVHSAFFDYDKDGDLDCYILNNSFRNVGGYDLIEGQRKIP